MAGISENLEFKWDSKFVKNVGIERQFEYSRDNLERSLRKRVMPHTRSKRDERPLSRFGGKQKQNPRLNEARGLFAEFGSGFTLGLALNGVRTRTYEEN